MNNPNQVQTDIHKTTDNSTEIISELETPTEKNTSKLYLLLISLTIENSDVPIFDIRQMQIVFLLQSLISKKMQQILIKKVTLISNVNPLTKT